DRKVITGSRLWDVVSPVIRKSGYKTDVFLRALGNIHAYNIPVLQDFAASMVSSSLSKFGFQMVTLLEDIRLDEIIRKERPGTKHDFQIRTEALKHYFSTQLPANVTRSYPLDELFCMIFLVLHADEPEPNFPDATDAQLSQLEKLKPSLFDSFTAQSTVDIT